MEQAQDRRAHPRYRVGECGYIETHGKGAFRGRQEVYIADISRGGLGLRLDREIPPGAAVRVTLTNCTVDGVVVHCRLDDQGYIAGIRARKEVRHAERVRARAASPPPTPPPPAEYHTTERVTILGIRIRRRSPAS